MFTGTAWLGISPFSCCVFGTIFENLQHCFFLNGKIPKKSTLCTVLGHIMVSTNLYCTCTVFVADNITTNKGRNEIHVLIQLLMATSLCSIGLCGKTYAGCSKFHHSISRYAAHCTCCIKHPGIAECSGCI